LHKERTKKTKKKNYLNIYINGIGLRGMDILELLEEILEHYKSNKYKL